MRTPGISFHEILRRLGYRGPPAQPELGDFVIPVSVFSDHRDLASPVLPATSLVGCNFQTTAGRFACFELVSKAPGGCLIVDCIAATSAAGGGNMKHTVADPGFFAAIGFPNASVHTNLATDLVVSPSRFGENAASVLPFNTFASMFVQQASSFRLPAPIYVAPGRQFFLENGVAGATLSISMLFYEYPAIPSHPNA